MPHGGLRHKGDDMMKKLIFILILGLITSWSAALTSKSFLFGATAAYAGSKDKDKKGGEDFDGDPDDVIIQTLGR